MSVLFPGGRSTPAERIAQMGTALDVTCPFLGGWGEFARCDGFSQAHREKARAEVELAADRQGLTVEDIEVLEWAAVLT